MFLWYIPLYLVYTHIVMYYVCIHRRVCTYDICKYCIIPFVCVVLMSLVFEINNYVCYFQAKTQERGTLYLKKNKIMKPSGTWAFLWYNIINFVNFFNFSK